jgi:peroxiredoxin
VWGRVNAPRHTNVGIMPARRLEETRGRGRDAAWYEWLVVAHDPTVLPPDLPVPLDDGAADHLLGAAVPDVALPSTDGRSIGLTASRAERTVVYAYPRTGRPGVEPLVSDWDLIPGARGCTPESCGFRDHHAELLALGADVAGLSTQTTEDQREAVERLGLPFQLLSDADLRLVRALRLPTFEVAGQTLLKRLTFVVRDGRIEHVWYPVFPPDSHAAEVVAWLAEQRNGRA